jgi:hypothetical protein
MVIQLVLVVAVREGVQCVKVDCSVVSVVSSASSLR